MQELKPVAIIKHIHGGSPLYQFGNAANNLPENTLLYPLPDTHRIVPVEQLRIVLGVASFMRQHLKADGEAIKHMDELQAIIDKENT